MFNVLFNRKKFSKDLAKDVVVETETLMQKIHSQQTDQFEDIKQILQHLGQKMTNLENRMASKELKDKHEYGHIQYKISELQTDLIFDTKKTKNKQ
jgi:hypothetical protein